MKKINDSSENEMIALFLNEEIKSKRFSEKLNRIISELNIDSSIIIDYDLSNDNDNKLRKEILKIYRGYSLNEGLFKNFPDTIKWTWVDLDINDIKKIKYIDYDYWEELSNGSRYAWDSRQNILNGKEIYEVSNQPFLNGAEYLKLGNVFEPLILLSSEDNKDKMIVLEGHSRLTAMCLVPEYIDKITALIGYTKDIKLENWNSYSAKNNQIENSKEQQK